MATKDIIEFKDHTRSLYNLLRVASQQASVGVPSLVFISQSKYHTAVTAADNVMLAKPKYYTAAVLLLNNTKYTVVMRIMLCSVRSFLCSASS